MSCCPQIRIKDKSNFHPLFQPLNGTCPCSSNRCRYCSAVPRTCWTSTRLPPRLLGLHRIFWRGAHDSAKLPQRRKADTHEEMQTPSRDDGFWYLVEAHSKSLNGTIKFNFSWQAKTLKLGRSVLWIICRKLSRLAGCTAERKQGRGKSHVEQNIEVGIQRYVHFGKRYNWHTKSLIYSSDLLKFFLQFSWLFDDIIQELLPLQGPGIVPLLFLTGPHSGRCPFKNNPCYVSGRLVFTLLLPPQRISSKEEGKQPKNLWLPEVVFVKSSTRGHRGRKGQTEFHL